MAMVVLSIFDHPSSLDFDLLAKSLEQLKKGQAIEVPLYDFPTHKRKLETLNCQPKKIILIDGILILDSLLVRNQLDEAIFFDTHRGIEISKKAREGCQRKRQNS